MNFLSQKVAQQKMSSSLSRFSFFCSSDGGASLKSGLKLRIMIFLFMYFAKLVLHAFALGNGRKYLFMDDAGLVSRQQKRRIRSSWAHVFSFCAQEKAAGAALQLHSCYIESSEKRTAQEKQKQYAWVALNTFMSAICLSSNRAGVFFCACSVCAILCMGAGLNGVRGGQITINSSDHFKLWARLCPSEAKDRP